MASDLRFALRMILTHRWFSAAVVATLALGIGLNTMVFTPVRAVLFETKLYARTQLIADASFLLPIIHEVSLIARWCSDGNHKIHDQTVGIVPPSMT
jgi:hypothetical protein